MTRLPKEILAVDGTYETMKKTMNMPDAEEDNNVLVVVMDEFGHYHSYAFCGAERDKVFERLRYFLKKQSVRFVLWPSKVTLESP